jgi:23S rRNA (guanosine2251-2'-O)-methyltransferase
VLAALHTDGVEVIGLDAAATEELHVLDLSGPTCLVVGAEGKGLRGATKRVCSKLAKLPMAGPIGSLNASVAAAIALYETVRQRRASGISSANEGAGAAGDEDELADEHEDEDDEQDG